MGKRQAVVLIHGVGEQRPMDSLRGFVEAVWSSDPSVHHQYAEAGIWSKPDNVSGSYELRRLTTSKGRAGVYTDFFELYWAHLMHGTQISHVLSWTRQLLLRWPWKVPGRLRGLWGVAVAATAIILTAFVLYGQLGNESDMPLQPWLIGAFGLVLSLVAGFVINSVGDAARYLDASPDNIRRRHEIRAQGIKLLQALHESGRYQRIIVVGHSLGSVIGYDVLSFLWSRYHDVHAERRDCDRTALHRLEELLRAPQLDVDEYQRAQADYLDELQRAGNPWLISDFVTMGCPLSYADILLANDAEELRRKQADREFPTCPPIIEGKKEDERTFAYDPSGRKRIRFVPHHGALFAPTRWTNLYFPVRFLLWGDFIGGPLAEIMGRGIRDVPVKTKQRRGFFCHTLYWSLPPGKDTSEAVEQLRAALDLGREIGEHEQEPDDEDDETVTTHGSDVET